MSKFIAKIDYNGNRHSVMLNGYRPQFVFDGIEINGCKDWSGSHIFINQNSAMPNEKQVWCEIEACHDLPLKNGITFFIREGLRIIGNGQIIRIIN